MKGFIKQLTGVRWIAALWVMLYHYQPALAGAGLLVPVVHEVLRVGSLGVDLFFTLSGFILTYTYLNKLGPALKARQAGHFLWLRLARIYPVHFVMLNVAGLVVIASGFLGQQVEKSWLNPASYLKQLLLIQEWGPNPSRGWNFVAWSLSMEWLAYLLMPLFALLLFRVRDRLPTWALAVCAFLCLTPLLGLAFTQTEELGPFFNGGWSSTFRILSEFACGAFVYLVVRRLTQDGSATPTTERVGRILSWVVPVGIVGLSVVMGHIPALQWDPTQYANEAPKYYVIIIPFLALWLGALAVSKGGPSTVLSHRRLVLGGFISYSLYMVHDIWFTVWREGMKVVGIESGPLYLLGVIALIGLAIVFAYAMWRFVEEPAREWMRKKVGERIKPIEEASMEPTAVTAPSWSDQVKASQDEPSQKS